MIAAEHDSPGDRRSLSLPRKAVPVIPGLFIFWGLAPIIATLALGLVRGDGSDPLAGNLLWLLPLISGPTLVTIFGLRFGKRWAVQLLRWLGWIAAAITIVSAIIGLLVSLSLLGGQDRDAVLGGQFLMIAVTFAAPFGWLMLRTIRRVRWLDPRSRPSEWEPPMPQPRQRRH